MRAVKTNAFLWAAVVIVIGFHEQWALAAGIVGLVLAVIPMFTAPRLVPERQHEHGQHAGTLYRLAHPGQGQMPRNPLPGDETRPSYTQGGWS
jgi:hypothetical protein